VSCCIVIPVYKPMNLLTRDELFSIRQSIKVFYRRRFFLIHPESLDMSLYNEYFRENGIGIKLIDFNDHFFRSTVSYSKLMLSNGFYKKFRDFDFILVYQTDAFAFEDKIDEWCAKGYSYVGAPWFKEFSPPLCTSELFLVGNGGFSLRRVSHCLKALNTFSVIFTLGYVWRTQLEKKGNSFIRNLLIGVRRTMFGNNSFWLLNDFYRYNNEYDTFQEDYFWGVICKKNFSWFKVPEPIEALGFSFEVQPEIMYVQNKNRLPMGCHAWQKYNPEFWRPFFSKIGYEI
jgi:Protein of unknown function (DUF5672)